MARSSLVFRNALGLARSVTACVTLSVCVAAEIPAAAQLRDLTFEDATTWEVITHQQLTADGHWLMYQLDPASKLGGDVTVVVKNTQKAIERRFAAGALTHGAGMLSLSASGKWAAFLVAPTVSELRDGVAPASAGLSLALVEVASGRRTDIPDVRNFSFGGDDWLVLHGHGVTTPGDPSTAGRAHPASLKLQHLPSGRVQQLGDATRFALDPTGQRLAWIQEVGTTSTLYVQRLADGKARIVDQLDGTTFAHIAWAPSGRRLAVLRGVTAPSLAILSDLDGRAVRRQEFHPEMWPGFPAAFEISSEGPKPQPLTSHRMPERAPLEWRVDEGGVFFGIRLQVDRPLSQGTAVERVTPGAPIVWHWQDVRLPKQIAEEAKVDATHSYLSFVSLATGRFIRLSDPNLPNVAAHPRSQYLLGYDDRQYAKERNVTGRQYRDYFLVSVRDGTRSLLRRRLSLIADARLGASPLLSPDCRSVLYVDGETGQYFVYEILLRIEGPLTEGLPTRFYDPQTISSALPPGWVRQPSPVQGWSSDGRYVLLTDLYDVWALPLRRGRALNLTGNGRRDAIRYSLTALDIESETDAVKPLTIEARSDIDLNEPMYFRTIDFRTMNTGLAERRPADGTVRQLASQAGDAYFVMARNAAVRLVRRETAVESPNYFRANERWVLGERLTDTNPQQREINWSPGARLLSYRNVRGDSLKAVLSLPANYVDGKSYPTIVSLYELQAGSLHRYAYPLDGGGGSRLDVTAWTSRGYAVLRPDIRPRWNNMRDATVEDVSAALDAAVSSGVVDSQRIGLLGHSFGGYEVTVLVTSLTRFGAAVAMSAPTQWVDWYAESHRTGVPRTFHGQGRHQPYIPQPWWENWQASFANSPLFDARRIATPLMLIHGRQDVTVPFANSERLFNVLRHIGDKEVVLLEYPDEGHGIVTPAAVLDASMRQIQFFDHFLKGEPAPEWLSGYSSHQPNPSQPSLVRESRGASERATPF